MTTDSGQVETADHRATAFVVEDVAEDAAAIEGVIRDAGYDPVLTGDSSKALALAVQATPRFIVLSADIHRGFNLCHRMKKNDGLTDVPIILVSGKAEPEVLRKHRMLPTRADAYLDKPIDTKVFLETLEQLLSPSGTDGFAEEDLPDAEVVELEEIGEVEVGEIPDRTLVNPGLETAVITYVEEEMSNLKGMVSRLENEKGGLTEKVQALETQLIDERKRIDSSLKVLLDGKLETAKPPEEPSVSAPIKPTIQTSEDADVLQARIESLEKQAADAAEIEQSLKAEIAQTTILFERLEAGYKESLATAEARREAAEAACTEAELAADDLREKVQSLEASLEELPALREMAARAEILEEDVSRANSELEELRSETEALRDRAGQVEELEKENGELKSSMAEIEAAKKEMEASVQELTAKNEELSAQNAELSEQVKTLTDRLSEIEESKYTAEQTAEFARAEVSEMRDRFNKLKSIIGDVAESPSGLIDNPASVLEDSIELVDDS
ncbi:MAG: hypothetical protein GXP54_05630 [Deltaproteobacteria bacterium]|nr:hypothetical protein [Deltaproteobacteria bacterium]